MIKVGNAGDQGIIEMSDLLFTVKGATAGAVLVEWNIHQTSQVSSKHHFLSTTNSILIIQGSAAMWGK